MIRAGLQELEVHGTDPGADVEDRQALGGPIDATAQPLEQPARRGIGPARPVQLEIAASRSLTELIPYGARAAGPADRSLAVAGRQARTSWRMNRM
jgi:hypothetical protein